jgi:hypothetical protein
MARLGNASGLRSLLRERVEEDPALGDVLHSLVAHVDRFDFNALIERLKVNNDE